MQLYIELIKSKDVNLNCINKIKSTCKFETIIKMINYLQSNKNYKEYFNNTIRPKDFDSLILEHFLPNAFFYQMI